MMPRTMHSITTVVLTALVAGFIGTAFVRAQVRVTSMRGSGAYGPGDTVVITWPDTWSGDAGLRLWNADTRERLDIADVGPHDRSYHWVIPRDCRSGSRYRITVEDRRAPRRQLLTPTWLAIGHGIGPDAVIAGVPGSPAIVVHDGTAGERSVRWSVPGAVSLRIHDANGNVVLRHDTGVGDVEWRLPSDQLASGWYVAECTSSSGDRMACGFVVVR